MQNQYVRFMCIIVPIKGSPAFVWNNEVTRTDAPYYDKRYHIPYDLPPNEVNFVGGLGRPKGNPRSKVCICNLGLIFFHNNFQFVFKATSKSSNNRSEVIWNA